MIRVTVELVPHGREEHKRVLGRMVIANDGSGSPTAGNYEAAATGKAPRVWKNATVRGFPRKRLLAWDLLYRVLHEMVGDRNR
jgi:hypothetical protein